VTGGSEVLEPLTGAIVLVIVLAAAVVAVCLLGRRVSVPELVQPTND
jgi:hypothetical protein